MPYTFNPFTGSFDNAPSVPGAEGAYLPLSGGTITGNLSVEGNFEAGGSSASVTILVSGNKVGINTETPNEELTVVGNISSSAIVYASGGNSILWNEVFTSYSANSSTFLTSETDSQTLSFDEVTKDLSISSGNTVSLSALVDAGIDADVRALTANWESTYGTVSSLSASWGALGEYLPLSGGTITGNLQVSGTTALSGTAIIGIGQTATFFVADSSVGINTETPNEELTVVGDISATGTIYALEGNSAIWTQTLAFNEGTKDLTISNGNTVSLSALADLVAADNEVRSLTANWESTYYTVSSLSASWSAADEVLVAQVTNADSVTLNRGDVVYTFGATGDVMSVKLASNASDDTSATTLGVVNETIIPNGIGYVTVAGRIDKMNFPAPFVEGDALWLGNTPGTFTRVKPVAPEHGVYLGVVERANNGNGIAYIKVQNGYELNELHDVLITSVSAGDVLLRNATNNLWVNVPLSADLWNSVYTNVNTNSAAYVKTVTTASPGTSAVTTIVAVSALPVTQAPGTLYILI